jgi:hypothetical protein
MFAFRTRIAFGLVLVLMRRQVSDKRWTWLFLRARARIQDWPMIKQLTLRKVFHLGFLTGIFPNQLFSGSEYELIALGSITT